MAAKRAKVVPAGLLKHDPVSPPDMNEFHYKELAILGAWRDPPPVPDHDGLPRPATGGASRVVTHWFSLDHIAQAFETIRDGRGSRW